MSGPSLGTCTSNVRSVALTVWELPVHACDCDAMTVQWRHYLCDVTPLRTDRQNDRVKTCAAHCVHLAQIISAALWEGLYFFTLLNACVENWWMLNVWSFGGWVFMLLHLNASWEPKCSGCYCATSHCIQHDNSTSACLHCSQGLK